MRGFILFSAFFLGCDPGAGGKDTAVTVETCDTRVADYEAELADVRACSDATACGQPISGTSCGCTRDQVARSDADLTALYALQAELVAESCDYGGSSVCDCPEALGFTCDAGTCAYNLVSNYAYLPACPTPGASLEVDAASVSGDTLTVAVAYGGGCASHHISLCWDQAFAESYPVQASLSLYHEDNDDSCDMWIAEDVALDLAPLKAAYQDAYQTQNGTISLHVEGQDATYTF